MASRLLVFTDNKLFAIAYEGFLGCAKAATPKEHKAAAEIFDALEEISIERDPPEVVPGFKAEDPLSPFRRVLNPAGDGVVILDEPAYQFLKAALDQMQCSVVLSRQVARVQKFIEETRTGEADELRKSVTIPGVLAEK